MEKLVEGVEHDLVHLGVSIEECRRGFSTFEDVSWAVRFFSYTGTNHCAEKKPVLFETQVLVALDDLGTSLGVEFSLVLALVALVVKHETVSLVSFVENVLGDVEYE